MATSKRPSKTGVPSGEAASKKIDEYLAGLNDWRGARLAEIRGMVHAAVPGVLEEWKWMGSPVWSSDGIMLVANALKNKVKLTFQHGAQLPDPKGLFNNGLDGNRWRSIDLGENDALPAAAFKALIKAAAKHNARHGG